MKRRLSCIQQALIMSAKHEFQLTTFLYLPFFVFVFCFLLFFFNFFLFLKDIDELVGQAPSKAQTPPPAKPSRPSRPQPAATRPPPPRPAPARPPVSNQPQVTTLNIFFPS